MRRCILRRAAQHAGLVALVALAAGCAHDACNRPLPCDEGDPPQRYATCARIICTPVQCDGCAAVRCWQGTAYRTQTPEGSTWSDGHAFAACDREGHLRAAGRVDATGIPACAGRCDPGFCPQPGPAPLPACQEP